MTTLFDQELVPISYTVTSSQSNFGYNFPFFSENDLIVTKIDTSGTPTVLTYNVDYTLSGRDNSEPYVKYPNGTTVTLTTPVTSGKVDLEPSIKATQTFLDLPSNDSPIPAAALQAATDKLTAILATIRSAQRQRLGLQLDDRDTTLPALETLKGKFLYVNASGEFEGMDGTGTVPSDEPIDTATVLPTGASERESIADLLGDVMQADVHLFGAVGDGVTDDYDAISAAHTYASANAVPLRFRPNKTYRVGTNLTVTADFELNGARLKPDSGRTVSLQGFGTQKRFGAGYWLDTSAGGSQTGRRMWDRTFYFQDWVTATDKTTDQTAVLKEALIEFFAGDYMVFDGGGLKIGISTDISIICGQDGMTSAPNATFQRGKVIRDLTLEWNAGTDSASQTTEYMLSIECPDSVVSGGAGFVELAFENVRFNMNNASKNGIRFASFFELYFRRCHWIQYEGGTAVFLDDQDNTSTYVSGNGSWFMDCLWDGEEFSAPPTGTPVLSYTGDVHVIGGYSSVTGPFDFHTGPAAIKGLHYSYRSSGDVDPMNLGVVFRDPREIMVANCDMDNCGILITNDGWAAHTPGGQNAETNWRTIHVIDNRVRLGDDPANFSGWCTVETHVASTTVRSIYFAGNTGAGGDSQSISEMYVKEVAPGTFTNFWKVHLHQGSFGWKNTGGLFDVASTSAGSRTTISEEEVQSTSFNFTGNRGSGITSNGSDGMCLRSNGADQWEVISNGNFVPAVDGRNIGNATFEVGDLFIKNSPTVSSDERRKHVLGPPGSRHKAVARRLLGLTIAYRQRESEDQRVSYGVNAQDIIAAYDEEGVDWREDRVVVHDPESDRYHVNYVALQQMQIDALWDFVRR